MKKTFFKYPLIFLVSVLAAVVFLLLGSCLPQTPIDANTLISAQQLYEEGNYPKIADKSFGSMLDNYTDALILSESKATSISQWDSIFTKPLYNYTNGGPVADLLHYAQDSSVEPTGFYVQYWMGFRTIIRLALCFWNYLEIRRYLAFLFFLLFSAVICSVAKHTDSKTGFLFALSIILMRPHVISVSLQFACCFFIAFAAMFVVPWIHKHSAWETLFFMELGILTMYFDFYTVPILTFGLPMVYLYILKKRDSMPSTAKQLGRNALGWFSGYVSMWLANLVLTSMLTDADGLGGGISSFFGRIGIEKTAELESYYNPITALRTVAVSLYSDHNGLYVYFIAVCVILAVVLFKLLHNKKTIHDFLEHKLLIIVALLPILWFIIAAQPTANHHWFQYRGIAVTFWAGLEYLNLTLGKNHFIDHNV